MYLKKPQFFGQWKFIAIDPSGNEISIPREGVEKTKEALVHKVFSQLKSFDEATDGRYLEKVRKQAQKHGLELQEYIAKVVEHQVCLRGSPTLCWDDGFGDTLHSFAMKVDNWVESLPVGSTAARAAVRVATFIATGKSQRRLSGCSKCGGTRTFSPDANNLGRAGTLNRITK